MGSGKDLVGQIIQYLTSKHLPYNENKSFQDWVDHTEFTRLESSWEIKKFADKLKDIVCLLIGCTRQDLEDRKFKEKELGEEWWYFTTISKGINNQMLPYLEWYKTIDKEYWKIIKLTPRKLLQLLGTEV